MTQRSCRACGGWHDLDAPWPRECYGHFPQPAARSHLSAPMQIRDVMDHTLNHADGRHYDSKRAYERAVRAAGCEIVGNEDLSKHVRKPQEVHDVKDDLRRAFAEHA